jgi:DNA-binding beta-propeller fold protein YncE
MISFALICSAIALSAATGAEAGLGYHLVEKVQISPARQIFDYAAADSVNRRIYLAHGEELVVLDADSNAVVSRIPAPQFDPSYGIGLFGRTTPYQGVHHVAIAADLGRGFTANGRAGTSTIFDLKTLRKIGEVQLTGKDPNAIIYEAATKRVFAFNVDTHNVTVFAAASGEVLKTIELIGEPSFAASDDKGHVFVNLIGKNLVQRIDARALVGDRRWPVGCKGPQNESMAIDKIHGRLFVGCRPDNRRMRFASGPSPDRIMQVMDTTNGRVVATVPIGGNPDEAAFDPALGLAFSANGEGSITVIKQDSPNKYRVLQTVTTEPGAARLAVDLKTHKLFVPNNDQDPSGHGPNFRVLVFSR